MDGGFSFRALPPLPSCTDVAHPDLRSFLSSRAQPADGRDRSRDPGLVSADRPPLAAVLLLPLPTQRRPQVSDGEAYFGYENRGQCFSFSLSLARYQAAK